MAAPRVTLAQPRDFKLQACVDYAHGPWNIHRAPKTLEIVPVARFFTGRCARLRALMMLPSIVGDVAIKMQRALDLAEFEITKKIEKGGPTGDFHDSIYTRWNELLAEQAEANLSMRTTGDPKEWDKQVLEELTTGLKPTEVMSAHVSASRALEASLMSYVTTAWTIIETMYADLWEEAVNAQPSSLAHLSGKATRLRKSNGPHRGQTSKFEVSKSVTLDSIAEHRFDISRKMGTILRTKFEFTHLDGTREATHRLSKKAAPKSIMPFRMLPLTRLVLSET